MTGDRQDTHTLGLDPALDAIFCAALTGIISSPDFHSSLYQQDPRAAVEFASSVVAAALSKAKTEKAGGEGAGHE